MRLDKILVPTDFSETADHAMAQAIELARRHRSQLHLFHVVEPYGAPPPNMMAIVRDYLEKLEKDAQKTLASKVEAIRGNDLDVQCSTSRHVAPFEAIADKVEVVEPDLVVMGTHGRRGFKRLILGSVAEKILRSVPANILTLSVEAPLIRSDRSFASILVPVDFSEHSRRALEAAVSLLADDGSLHVVHVVDSPIYPTFYPAPVIMPADADPALADKVREQLRQWLGGQEAHLHVRHGAPHRQILEAQDEANAELIVMGTRGLTGLEHVLLGSVTERVVRESPVAVLTVH